MSATTVLLLNGITNQALKLKINKISGPPKNKTEEAFCGTGFSFKINFKASARGCKTPKKPVQFGPLRFCILAKTLRSKRVKNATLNITFRIKYKDNNTNQIVKLTILKNKSYLPAKPKMLVLINLK